MEEWMIVVLFLGLVAIAALISLYLDRRRTAAIQAFADSWGFDYREPAKLHLPSAVWHFNLFSKGRNRRLRDLIQGRQGEATISVGDYSYTTGRGKNRRTHCQTVVIIESERLHLPGFLLAPENVLHKIGGLFGHDDIDFDSHPNFSKRYLLKGFDEDSIRTCFHDGVLNFYQRRHQVSTEGHNSLLIYYKAHRLANPNDWNKLIGVAMEAYEQFIQQY
ncbi:MAG: hypothetical protein AAF766_21500 [Cyanobacteria bacterium P01_D01_bin.14]